MFNIYIKFIRNFLNFFDFFSQKKIINFFLFKFKKKELIFFDVGAHFGETVNLFGKYLNIKQFHCFEASPKDFEILKKKIAKSNYNKICYLNNFGLGQKNYDSFINQTKETSSSTINDINLSSNYFKRKLKILNISKIDNYYEKIPIKISYLDHYINQNKVEFIDILKIDTEGFELEVLKGLINNFQKVKFVYFEHHYDDMIKKNYTFSNIHNFLEKNNFKKIMKSKMIFRKSFEYIYENVINI